MHVLIKDAKIRMDKSIEALRHEIAKVRSGKATTALLDGIKVDYYGSMVPLNQVGNVSVMDAHTLSITPWEKPMVSVIEKAILEANIGGITPAIFSLSGRCEVEPPYSFRPCWRFA